MANPYEGRVLAAEGLEALEAAQQTFFQNISGIQLALLALGELVDFQAEWGDSGQITKTFKTPEGVPLYLYRNDGQKDRAVDPTYPRDVHKELVHAVFDDQQAFPVWSVTAAVTVGAGLAYFFHHTGNYDLSYRIPAEEFDANYTVTAFQRPILISDTEEFTVEAGGPAPTN